MVRQRVCGGGARAAMWGFVSRETPSVIGLNGPLDPIQSGYHREGEKSSWIKRLL